MSLLLPLYGFVTWILWRGRTPTRLLFASFIAIFGFFMVAPRMHERYIYPAIALSVPLALEAPEMMAVFVIVSLTALINLAYILHTLNTVVFLNGRDGFAMATSALNVVALGTAVYYGITRLQDGSGAGTALGAFFEKFAMPRQVEDYVEPDAVAPPWIATDTIIISALLIVAACTRFYHLGHPAEIVFDEVHFVAQGRHYLHGESFLDPHPPLAKLIIAAGIAIFGDHPWGWRVGNATLGTAIVGITYLLGRRMSGSRLTGALAGGIILLDGMYLVDSHYAVIDIVYLTCAAVSYLLFFKFVQTPDAAARRRILPWIGLTLGLTLASKLYIPAITFLLVMGFILYVLLKERPVPAPVVAPPRRAQGDEGTADCLEVEEVQAGGTDVGGYSAGGNRSLRHDLDDFDCAHLHRCRCAAFLQRRDRRLHRADRCGRAGIADWRDSLAPPHVDRRESDGAAVLVRRSDGAEDRRRVRADRCGRLDHLHRGVDSALLARMVGRDL